MSKKTTLLVVILILLCASIFSYFYFLKSEDNAFLKDPEGNPTLYSKDSFHVYITSPQSGEKEVLEGADPATFLVLASIAVDCFKEKQNCRDGNFPYAMVLAKDNHAVYYTHRNIIPQANPATFEVLRSPEGSLSVYSRDSKNIFVGTVDESVSVLDADYASFQVLSVTTAKDKNHQYFEGEIEQ